MWFVPVQIKQKSKVHNFCLYGSLTTDSPIYLLNYLLTQKVKKKTTELEEKEWDL